MLFPLGIVLTWFLRGCERVTRFLLVRFAWRYYAVVCVSAGIVCLFTFFLIDRNFFMCGRVRLFVTWHPAAYVKSCEAGRSDTDQPA